MGVRLFGRINRTVIHRAEKRAGSMNGSFRIHGILGFPEFHEIYIAFTPSSPLCFQPLQAGFLRAFQIKQMYRQAGAKLPADAEGDERWSDATDQNRAYVDRQDSTQPALYIYRAGASHCHSESGDDFEDANRHLSEHQYSRRRSGLDLHRAKSRGNRGADHYSIRACPHDDRRQH